VKRRLVQYISALVMNPYLYGLLEGRIYKGFTKNICVPGLNCYSCPAAMGACPLGALQTVLGSSRYTISHYVSGVLLIYGVLMGRYICGFLCPFGLIQELLYKIPSPVLKIPRWMGYIKYIILITFVIVLPMFVVNNLGMGDPWFCKYICPAGTLEGGIPLLAANPVLRNAAGNLFLFKLLILILVIIVSILSFRPFCRVICPLGAIYGLLNPVSIYRYKVDTDKCITCGKCAEVCKMGVAMYKEPNSPECIRCGECKEVCPVQAISSGFTLGDNISTWDGQKGGI